MKGRDREYAIEEVGVGGGQRGEMCQPGGFGGVRGMEGKRCGVFIVRENGAK